MNTEFNTKPWYASKTLAGALITIITARGGMYGMEVDSTELEPILLGIGGLIGSGLAIYGRLSANTILTKKRE